MTIIQRNSLHHTYLSKEGTKRMTFPHFMIKTAIHSGYKNSSYHWREDFRVYPPQLDAEYQASQGKRKAAVDQRNAITVYPDMRWDGRGCVVFEEI